MATGLELLSIPFDVMDSITLCISKHLKEAFVIGYDRTHSFELWLVWKEGGQLTDLDVRDLAKAGWEFRSAGTTAARELITHFKRNY